MFSQQKNKVFDMLDTKQVFTATAMFCIWHDMSSSVTQEPPSVTMIRTPGDRLTASVTMIWAPGDRLTASVTI